MKGICIFHRKLSYSNKSISWPWFIPKFSSYLIDIKTAKPNKGGFKEFKRTLLTWVACYAYANPQANIHSLIAIPYNPYEPKPYERWTMAGMLDLDFELKVAKEFWDFIGGVGSYEIILDSFEEVQ